MNTYNETALTFLSKHGITFSAKLLGEEQSTTFPTCKNYVYEAIFERFCTKTQRMISASFDYHGSVADYNKGRKALSAYDIIACLTKYNPGMFCDFCTEYGYNEDSRKHFTTYEAVCQEWKKVSGFFSKLEIKEMQEIN